MNDFRLLEPLTPKKPKSEFPRAVSSLRSWTREVDHLLTIWTTRPRQQSKMGFASENIYPKLPLP